MENKFIYEFTWYYILTGPLILVIYMYVSGIYFYVTHYALHKINFLYKYVHKTHHIWTKPFAISTIACHPIELLLNNIFFINKI